MSLDKTHNVGQVEQNNLLHLQLVICGKYEYTERSIWCPQVRKMLLCLHWWVKKKMSQPGERKTFPLQCASLKPYLQVFHFGSSVPRPKYPRKLNTKLDTFSKLSKKLFIWDELAWLSGLAHLGEMIFISRLYGIFRLASIKRFVMSLEKDCFDHVVLIGFFFIFNEAPRRLQQLDFTV